MAVALFQSERRRGKVKKILSLPRLLKERQLYIEKEIKQRRFKAITLQAAVEKSQILLSLL